MVTPKTLATLLLLAAALLPAGCASRVPRLDYDALDAQPAAEVIELWESQREVLVRVIQGKKFTIREFEAALRFFEKATGLPAHQASTRYGRMPGEQLTEDLQTWDDWFRADGVALRVEDLR